jgi:transposase
MAKPYSGDLRESVVRAVRSGRSCAEVAEIFRISKRSVERYVALWRSSGHVASHAKFGGHMKPLLEKNASDVESLIKEEPDATLEELREALAARKIKVGTATIFRFLKRLGYSNKKNGIWCRAEEARRSGPKRSVQKTATRA